MLPFLKDRHQGGMASPVEVTIKRTHDDDFNMDMLDAVAEDILSAIHAKDKKLLKSALEALVEHVQELDEVQDQMEE